jgi:hypothetical protein
MENFRENNYGYPLPAAVIELIEEFEEDNDEEKMECLGKILEQCDHTDLKILRDYEKLSQIIENYFEILNEPYILLTKLVDCARNGRC